MTTHKKHAELARPHLGQFGRNEWAILGMPCGDIKQLAATLSQRLSPYFNLAYLDADHQDADAGAKPNGVLGSGAMLAYTDKIDFHRFDRRGKLTPFQIRQQLIDQDGILVNGNHFPAGRQIVVLDPRKENSLRKRLSQLTDVQLILSTEAQRTPYDFLKRHLGEWEQVPIMPLEDIKGVANFIGNRLESAAPELFGLVLAGGHSKRMGQDKGLIDYHGKAQREHAADLLSQFCKNTYISCRPDQVDAINSEYRALPDTFLDLGPFGAILSAFRSFPDKAWMVIATDLPLLDEHTLKQLRAGRHPSKVATAFHSPVTDFPEPLIAIWEPRSYSTLLQFLAQGYSCPRKVLINSEVNLLEPDNPETLKNVNHPEELEEIIQRIKK